MTSPTGGTPDGQRRARTWRDWYILALATGATLFCLGPSLIGMRTMLSVNFLTDFLPWSSGGNQSVGHQFCQSDTIDSVMPGIAYTRRQIFSGHLGSWQSITAGGGPMSALPNQGLLDPLSLPYWILPLSWAPAVVVLVSWVAAIGGTFLFLRRLSVSRPAATLAGFIFATSGFMVMWTNWPQTRTAALIPALFWATERVAHRSRPSDGVLLAAVVASMLLGGFPAVTGYGLYAAGAYFVVRILVIHGRDWLAVTKRVGLAAGGLVLGGALSAVQMLPFADFYKVYNPVSRTSEAKLGLPLGDLATTFAPGTNGLCVVGRSGLPTAYGPVIPVELVAYVGSAALVLAALGAAFVVASRRWDQRGARTFFLAACVVIAVLGWVSPTARSVAAKLPVFSNNFIGRARSVLGFGLAILAAFGFDWLTSRRTADRHGQPQGDSRREQHEAARVELPAAVRAAAWPVVVLMAAAVAGMVVVRASHRDAFVGRYVHAWDRAIWIPLVLIAASALVATAARMSRRAGADLAFVVLPVLVVAQGTAFFHTVMPGDNPKLFYPSTADHRFLAAHLGHDRFASAGLTLYPSTAYYYGLRSPTGHEFTDGRWLDLLRAVDPKVMASATNSDFTTAINQSNVGDQPILDQMGVRYAVLPPTELAGVANPLPAAGGTVDTRHSPVGCTLPAGPIRGVTFRLAAPLSAGRPPTNATLHVTVHAGDTTLQSGLYLPQPEMAAGSVISVPVAGEGLTPGAPSEVSIWVTGSAAPLVVDGSGGRAACATVAPGSDGLKLVFADPGAVIYQRLTALPRIRWATQPLVVEKGPAQISALQKGIPASDVVVSGGPGRPTNAAAGPAATGAAAGMGATAGAATATGAGATTGTGAAAGATVDITDDSGDRVAARVDAASAGYLVVADPMQLPGWSVTVDGRAARALDANYAMVAVSVPAGRHTIAFSYRAPGELAGAVITGAGLVVSGVVLWWDRRSQGRGQGRSRSARHRRSRGATVRPTRPGLDRPDTAQT